MLVEAWISLQETNLRKSWRKLRPDVEENNNTASQNSSQEENRKYFNSFLRNLPKSFSV